MCLLRSQFLGKEMIDVFDNVLEEHNAILIDDEVKKMTWRYNYHSDKRKPNKMWNVLCGHDEEECGKLGYLWAHDLFQTFTNKLDFVKKYKIDGYKRIYCNAHTHGVEPHIHKDDGDFTMIYYPYLNWETEWGGGTAIFEEEENDESSPLYAEEFKNLQIDKHVNYKGNRLIVFDEHLPHQAQPVSRQCYELRTCVVFKCNISGNSRERLDFYKENKNG